MAKAPSPLAITGLGLVSAAGLGAERFRQAVAQGETQLGALIVASGLPVAFGGRFPPEIVPPEPAGQRARRALELALDQAVDQARGQEHDASFALGTALAGTEAGELVAARPLTSIGPTDRDHLRRLPLSALGRSVAQARGLRGGTTFSVTCVSALYALEQVAADLALGRTGLGYVGGLDTLSRYIQGGFCALEALSTSAGVRAPLPGDGIVLGEAAAVVAVEPEGSAAARGARELAVIEDWVLKSDATHVTSPDPEGGGMRRAVSELLARADVDQGAIERISITAASSPLYQHMYDKALAGLIPAWRERAVTWEAEVGHVLSASGAVALVHAALAFAERPQTERFLCLVVGFGGMNGAVLLRRPNSGSAVA